MGPKSCLLEAGQLRHLLHGVDERVQSFHAKKEDVVVSQAVQGRTDVKGKTIVGQTALTRCHFWGRDPMLGFLGAAYLRLVS